MDISDYSLIYHQSFIIISLSITKSHSDILTSGECENIIFIIEFILIHAKLFNLLTLLKT